MLPRQSGAGADGPDGVLIRALPASEWLTGFGGPALPSLGGIAARQRLDGYLLRPYAPLHRARMVRLGVAWKKLSPYANAARAWELVSRFFPESLPQYSPQWLAFDILPDFLHQVEDAGWFEIDWRTINWVWEILMNEDEGDGAEEGELDWGTDSERTLLDCLHYIPVLRYNWSEEEWWNNAVEEYPLLAAFKSMVDPGYKMALGYGWQPGSFEDYWLRARCEAVATEKGEPFGVLPVIVDYVRGVTGNWLLDNHSAGNELDWPMELGHTWDRAEDVEELRRLYAEAGPVWQRIVALCEWLDTHDTLEGFIDELLYDGDDDGEENQDDGD